MEDAATESPEVLGSAVGALAAPARLPPWGLVHWILATPPAVVTAVHKAIHRIGDPLQPELPDALGELILVAGDELREVGTEEPLEGARSPLAVAAGGRRIQGERERACGASRAR